MVRVECSNRGFRMSWHRPLTCLALALGISILAVSCGHGRGGRGESANSGDAVLGAWTWHFEDSLQDAQRIAEALPTAAARTQLLAHIGELAGRHIQPPDFSIDLMRGGTASYESASAGGSSPARWSWTPEGIVRLSVDTSGARNVPTDLELRWTGKDLVFLATENLIPMPLRRVKAAMPTRD